MLSVLFFGLLGDGLSLLLSRRCGKHVLNIKCDAVFSANCFWMIFPWMCVQWVICALHTKFSWISQISEFIVFCSAVLQFPHAPQKFAHNKEVPSCVFYFQATKKRHCFKSRNFIELSEICVSVEKKPSTVSVPFTPTDIFVKVRNQLQPFCSLNTNTVFVLFLRVGCLLFPPWPKSCSRIDTTTNPSQHLVVILSKCYLSFHLNCCCNLLLLSVHSLYCQTVNRQNHSPKLYPAQ